MRQAVVLVLALAGGCVGQRRVLGTDPPPREAGSVDRHELRSELAAAAHLPAPHQLPAKSLPPPVRSLSELRGLVGRRDKRASFAAVLAWSRELGQPLAALAQSSRGSTEPRSERGSTAQGSIEKSASAGAELVAWAEAEHRVRATTTIEPGDLVVFDRVTGEAAFDLVAIAIDRDARGVTEVVYVGGGVVRRGFVDTSRPGLRRDGSGNVVNTYLRHGKRWPPKGTRYLAGELVSRVIRGR